MCMAVRCRGTHGAMCGTRVAFSYVEIQPTGRGWQICFIGLYPSRHACGRNESPGTVNTRCHEDRQVAGSTCCQLP